MGDNKIYVHQGLSGVIIDLVAKFSHGTGILYAGKCPIQDGLAQ